MDKNQFLAHEVGNTDMVYIGVIIDDNPPRKRQEYATNFGRPGWEDSARQEAKREANIVRGQLYELGFPDAEVRGYYERVDRRVKDTVRQTVEVDIDGSTEEKDSFEFWGVDRNAGLELADRDFRGQPIKRPGAVTLGQVKAAQQTIREGRPIKDQPQA